MNCFGEGYDGPLDNKIDQPRELAGLFFVKYNNNNPKNLIGALINGDKTAKQDLESGTARPTPPHGTDPTA